jgi:hypothetical protein
MNIPKGQKQAISSFQALAQSLTDKLPTKVKPFFLSFLLRALLAVTRRRTVTAWWQAAQIEDDFRQVFYHIPNIRRKSLKLFDAMLDKL